MLNEEEILCRLRLFLANDVGAIRAKMIVEYFGSATVFFTSSKKERLKVNALGVNIINSVLSVDIQKAKNELNILTKNNVGILFFDDPIFPSSLKEYKDSPFLLLYKGDIECLKKNLLSIVGTRKPTHYGKKIIATIIQEISNTDCCTVSGLAYGMDSFVHRESIINGIPTVAVLGSGLGDVYPKENKKLSDDIIKNGGLLLSEYLYHKKPNPKNFPHRNRIIAGIAEALLIIETKIKGGSMVTAKIAYSYNKPIYCVPGRLNDEVSMGCNYLLSQKQAELFFSSEQLLSELFWTKPEVSNKSKLKINFNQFSEEEKSILEILKQNEKLKMDELLELTNMTNPELSSHLLQLELQGVVQSLPGKFFSLQ